MKINKRNDIFRTLLSGMALVLATSCSDWTDVESLNIHNPSIKDQNPALYAQYVKSLNEFKASEHQVVIVSVNNIAATPTSRSQHLTDLPDSVDYICLNNIMEVSKVNVSEMEEVRQLGTKVLGLVDFDAIESAWKVILEEEAANPPMAPEETEGEGEEEEPVDNATRFIQYCKGEMDKLITANNALGVDGIVANFTGFDLNILVGESAIAAETARQAVFFDAVTSWKAANANKVILFKGSPQNVMNKGLLSDCKYIIVNAHSAKNLYEMSYYILMASAKDVPTNRFVMGVTTPYVTNSGSNNGEFGDGSSAIIGAAQWAVSRTPEYTKAGISIDSAETDYFNAANVYPTVKEAINTLSPTVK